MVTVFRVSCAGVPSIRSAAPHDMQKRARAGLLCAQAGQTGIRGV
jgi:hypothetical protein